MQVDNSLLSSEAVKVAVRQELASRNRLLPPRWDYVALRGHESEISKWIKPQIRRGPSGEKPSIVLADKAWRGTRPLTAMSIEDSVLLRVLVNRVESSLSADARERPPIDIFRNAPLDVPEVRYVCKTDIASYYEFVDHDILAAELVSQTGEEPAIEALSDVLESVMGRRVGIPQIHTSSNILGDVYLDPVRRSLIRQGYRAFRFSDDFRISAHSLGEARSALEACALEARELGLVLNEKKTYTYGIENYRKSLNSFSEAEKRLFAMEAQDVTDAFQGLGFLHADYGDGDADQGLAVALGVAPLGGGIDEDEALGISEEVRELEIEQDRFDAARRAWDLWVHEEETEEVQAGQDAAVTQSLLGRALPILGAGGDPQPLKSLKALLRYEPGLTPQVVEYVQNFGETGQRARIGVRKALDEVIKDDILSPWQSMWIAHTMGGVRRAVKRHPYEDWLIKCTNSGNQALAATSAGALGRINRSGSAEVASVVDRVGRPWRRLAFWGLIGLDRSKARSVAGDVLDNLLLSATDQ